MEIQYKKIDINSKVYTYVSNLKDIIIVDIYVVGDAIENFDVHDRIGLTDDFQLIKNVEIILKDVGRKICNLKYGESLVVYVKEYDDKYLFIKHI